MREYGGRVRFVVENYGHSSLAERFGVTRYPAIFVDDVLVATPSDFGFYGRSGAGGGRYAPWRSAESHGRFRADLARMLDLTLAGRKSEARAVAKPADAATANTFPDVTFASLDGRKLTRADLAGRVVLVDFWATWCPPCRGTLNWLSALQQKHGDRLAIVTVALESDSARVEAIRREVRGLEWTLGSPDLVRRFGDVSAVPTMLLYDRDGRSAGAYYGAPPTLHADGEAKIAELMGAKAERRD